MSIIFSIFLLGLPMSHKLIDKISSYFSCQWYAIYSTPALNKNQLCFSNSKFVKNPKYRQIGNTNPWAIWNKMCSVEQMLYDDYESPKTSIQCCKYWGYFWLMNFICSFGFQKFEIVGWKEWTLIDIFGKKVHEKWFTNLIRMSSDCCELVAMFKSKISQHLTHFCCMTTWS